jgi:hypothetical protein
MRRRFTLYRPSETTAGGKEKHVEYTAFNRDSCARPRGTSVLGFSPPVPFRDRALESTGALIFTDREFTRHTPQPALSPAAAKSPADHRLCRSAPRYRTRLQRSAKNLSQLAQLEDEHRSRRVHDDPLIRSERRVAGQCVDAPPQPMLKNTSFAVGETLCRRAMSLANATILRMSMIDERSSR